ncbi:MULTISPECIES: GreA/GreB family elongation factor [unclassified Flavobacterium]|uniref:GreA/GreB family elongation factor n=1 Tax=unclassified Flavobacterium TaxID=196869 RepID=UPI000EACC3D0|nr:MULTISPECIES: GreA/GreB family elongation factor [unclassified Flavobacterium]RKS03150.1 regulator of nucleoside diphosphate kinase [Flavobacterium sp. 102]
MKYGGLVVEKKEYEIVKKITSKEAKAADRAQKIAIEKLLTELKSAKLLSSADMPSDAVRLNSTVTFVIADLFRKRFKIVSPEQSDIAQNKLSILSPMGLALFGYSQDDVVEWQFPSGPNTIRIIQVDQDN